MVDDFKVPEEVQEELDKLRKKNRIYTYAFIGVVTVGLLFGTVFYARQQADAEMSKYFGSYYNAAYTAAGDSTAGGGGGCGGGAGGSTGGCGSSGAGGCGGGGSILQPGGPTMADLEKQGLAAFTKETGVKDAVAKVKDYGCHIQVDIYDSNNKLLKSYGYKGESLYVIQ